MGPVKNKQLKDKNIKTVGYDSRLNDYGYKIKC